MMPPVGKSGPGTSSISRPSGTSVASTVADVQAAVDLLATDKKIKIIVPAYTGAAVHAIIKAHVVAAAKAAARSERFAFLPVDPTSDKAAIKAATVIYNSEWIGAVAQRRGYFDDLSVLQAGDSLSTALCAAGMMAAGESGEPLTHKFLSAQSLTQDGGWSPGDDGDREELLRSGLIMAESIEGTGFRWIRGISTYQKRSDRIRTELSSMESASDSLVDLREFTEEKLVGRKNALLTADGVRNVAEGRLAEQVTAGMIVAWRNVGVVQVGDTFIITYEVAPAEPTNFVVLEAHVYTATSAA